MAQSIDDESRNLARYHIAQYQRLMREADKAEQEGRSLDSSIWKDRAMKVARRVDDLRGLTDECVS